MRHLHHTHRRPRAGFTLIEILVVLGIIATLVALSTAAYQRVRITQMVRTSEQTVAKIQTGIDTQVKIIADNVRRESVAPNQSPDFIALKPFCDNDDDRTAAVLLLCRLRQYLPQTQAELAATSFQFPASGGVTFTRPAAFAQVGATASASDGAALVSAAALYAALSGQAQGGNSFSADEVLSGATLDVAGASGNLRVFKDGWGNPIPFVRCYQSAELDGPEYCDIKVGVLKDPFDPRGKLFGWSGTPASAVGRPAAKALGTNSFPSFDFGHNTNVLVYSAGVDKNYGTADDIMGYRLRSIGAKGAKP